jgi:xanthine dehydrogenase accessory factor
MSRLITWEFIIQNIEQQIPLMLMYVLESSGSSPGRQGFCMAVNAEGEMEGSIGGGIMEHKLVEMAKDKLRNNEQGILRKQIHDKYASKDQSGMICSGEQTVFLYLIKEKDKLSIKQIIQAIEQKKVGKLTLTRTGMEFKNEKPGQQFHFEMKDEDNWLYEEAIGVQPHIHIIGGGHCSLALSKVMTMLGFYVHVYDDRPELNTMQQNEFANEKKLLSSYNDLSMLLDNAENDYVVLMTFGYKKDDIALRALINKRFRYLGLLGSKKKIEKMFNDYRSEGWSDEKLQTIHAPVGLNIKSETPEEIAISIAAEIIKVKNNADKNS